MARYSDAAQRRRLPDPRRLPVRLRPHRARRRLPALGSVPRAEARDKVKTGDAAALLAAAQDAIKHNDQGGACAAVQRYGDEGHPPRPVLDMLLGYAVSEDGALHAEKYYRTTSEEFASLRPAFRWRQLVALARVTASEYGRPAPGYSDACGLLKV